MSNHQHPWMDPTLTPQERAEALVAAMSTEQKIAQLHGGMETVDIYSLDLTAHDDDDPDSNIYELKRHVPALEALQIPRMRVTNGPVGVGMGDGPDAPPATSLPMTIAVAAGFDAGLAAGYGDIIGSETATTGSMSWKAPA